MERIEAAVEEFLALADQKQKEINRADFFHDKGLTVHFVGPNDSRGAIVVSDGQDATIIPPLRRYIGFEIEYDLLHQYFDVENRIILAPIKGCHVVRLPQLRTTVIAGKWDIVQKGLIDGKALPR